MEQSPVKNQRIEAVDALRGFAVMAILGVPLEKCHARTESEPVLGSECRALLPDGGALLYFPFGLNLAPHCGYTVSLMIGIAVFLLQVMFCKWWLGRHKQGPLEYIWHKWTWLGSDK